MSFQEKLAAFRKEYKFRADVGKRFFEMFAKWRAENADEDAVYIYVGSPHMAEEMIKRSPLWVRFEAFERSQLNLGIRTGDFSAFDAKAQMRSQQAQMATRDESKLPDWYRKQADKQPHNWVCQCAACASARASRITDESKKYDA